MRNIMKNRKDDSGMSKQSFSKGASSGQQLVFTNNFDKEKFERKAVIFSDLHHQTSKVFVLPNVWDALSAKQFELAGAKAIATTSAGIATILGYPDGEVMPKSEMLAIVKRIVSVVDVPVSVDIETGYGRSIMEVCDTVSEVIRLGAVGINIEDADPDHAGSLFPIDVQVEKIRAIRQLANQYGVSLYINARTDSYWLKALKTDACYEETIQRLLAYRDAGANGVFVPGLTDLAVASKLRELVGLPINLLGGAWVEHISQLVDCNINRLSVGSGVSRKVAASTAELAQHIMSEEFINFRCLEGAMSYQETQNLFAAVSE
ncbi:MAG: dihydrouridine synthase [Legionella sp.]|nr:MAG: dihydrouridine synthase [Legionella sp.]